jgi:hypothetical protein
MNAKQAKVEQQVILLAKHIEEERLKRQKLYKGKGSNTNKSKTNKAL